MTTMIHSPKTKWHRLLGRILEEWLAPVGITVQTEVPVSSDPSKADILLLRNQRKRWTIAQKNRLPDGIRESSASHILIEFKYTESVNKDVFLQILSYDTLYRRSQKLKWHQLESFLLSSKTPRKKILEDFGYQVTDTAGVYRTQNIVCSHITLVLLNELSNEPHNLPLKCFASQREVQSKTFEQIEHRRLGKISNKLEWFLNGLERTILSWKGDQMSQVEEITPEYIIDKGREWVERMVSTLPTDQRLKGLNVDERLKGLNVDERLKGLNVDERLKGLSTQEVLQKVSPKEIEEYLESIKKNE